MSNNADRCLEITTRAQVRCADYGALVHSLQQAMVLAGENSEQKSIRSGDIVIDKDDDSPNPAVVIKTPNATAEEWQVPGGTVAETNPDYPSDERVAVVVFQDELEEEYPLYTGGIPLAIAQVNRDGLNPYTFPKSRLRCIGQLEPIEIELNEIDPNPYHARNFSAEDNRDYIGEIRERGHPDPPPVVRYCGDRYELLNGHKRVWASYVAGLESIPCDVHYEADVYAARTWARYHLQGYSETEQQVALRRIESCLGEHEANYIKDEYLSEDDSKAETEGSSGGERTDA